MASHHPPALGARFHVEEVLMDGPFERAYRARDAVLHRDVLLKLPAREAFDGWTVPVKERLLREARALARIRHPNVAPIHHVEETAEGPLLVLDLPRGETLAERLQNGPLPVDETVAIARQLADALAHVHQQSVVHRAVGPSTVRLLANGTVELGSFTFAKEFGGARGTSLVNLRGAAAQTAARAQHLPEYPAPEQLAGHTADPRADVFALGCTMFRCLAGRDAFPPGTEHAQAPDLRTLRKDVGRPLAEVVRKCLAFAKSARYATAREVLDALQALHVASPPRRNRAALATVASVAVVAVVGTAWFVRESFAGPPLQRGDAGSQVSPDERLTREYAARYRRVHGLFIAIGQGYTDPKWGKLVNPTRDVEAIIQQLRTNDPAWDAPEAIVMLPDERATKANICAALERLRRTEVIDKDDAVLVWFAGHGAYDPHKFALCARDAAGDHVGDGSGYIDDEVLTSFAARCPAKHVLVVLDCCHSGAALGAGDLGQRLRGRDGEEDGEQPGDAFTKRFSREFLCSTGSKQPAADGAMMSPFTEAVLAQLRMRDKPYVAARYLANRVEEAMRQRGGRLFQVPKFQASPDQEGSFVFALRR